MGGRRRRRSDPSPKSMTEGVERYRCSDVRTLSGIALRRDRSDRLRRTMFMIESSTLGRNTRTLEERAFGSSPWKGAGDEVEVDRLADAVGRGGDGVAGLVELPAEEVDVAPVAEDGVGQGRFDVGDLAAGTGSPPQDNDTSVSLPGPSRTRSSPVPPPGQPAIRSSPSVAITLSAALPPFGWATDVVLLTRLSTIRRWRHRVIPGTGVKIVAQIAFKWCGKNQAVQRRSTSACRAGSCRVSGGNSRAALRASVAALDQAARSRAVGSRG